MNAIVFLPLTQGQVAVIDFEDFEIVRQFKWHAYWNPRSKTFYAQRKQGKGHVWLHCDLLGIKGIDHINGNGLDNQRSNLREATHAQNMQNRAKRAAASSTFKGVYWCRDNKKWRAQLQVNRRRIFLGYFLDEISAALAYNAAAKKQFGEFARPNPV